MNVPWNEWIYPLDQKLPRAVRNPRFPYTYYFLCWPENYVFQTQKYEEYLVFHVLIWELCFRNRMLRQLETRCADLKTVSFRNWVSHASRPGTMLTSPPYIVTSKLKVGIPTKATCIPPMQGSSSNNGLQIILALPLIVILSIPAYTTHWVCTALLVSVRSRSEYFLSADSNFKLKRKSTVFRKKKIPF